MNTFNMSCSLMQSGVDDDIPSEYAFNGNKITVEYSAASGLAPWTGGKDGWNFMREYNIDSIPNIESVVKLIVNEGVVTNYTSSTFNSKFTILEQIILPESFKIINTYTFSNLNNNLDDVIFKHIKFHVNSIVESYNDSTRSSMWNNAGITSTSTYGLMYIPSGSVLQKWACGNWHYFSGRLMIRAHQSILETDVFRGISGGYIGALASDSYMEIEFLQPEPINFVQEDWYGSSTGAKECKVYVNTATNDLTWWKVHLKCDTSNNRIRFLNDVDINTI